MLERQTFRFPVVEFEEVRVRRIIRGPWEEEVADSFDGKTERLLTFEDYNGRIFTIVQRWLNTPINEIGLSDADSERLSNERFDNISNDTILNFRWINLNQNNVGPDFKQLEGIGIENAEKT